LLLVLCLCYLLDLKPQKLAGNRVDGSTGLLDLLGDTRDHHVDDYRKESGEERGERVVHTTVLLNLDDLVNSPANEVHPRESRGERKAGDDGVERLSFELTRDGNESIGGDISRHCIIYEEILFW